MLTTLMVLYFISSFIVVFTQIGKINRIVFKYGLNLFSKKTGITSSEKNTIIKAFSFAFGYLIGGFLLVGLIAYLLNPDGFTIFY